MYGNTNSNGKYWAIFGQKLSEPQENPDHRGPEYRGTTVFRVKFSLQIVKTHPLWQKWGTRLVSAIAYTGLLLLGLTEGLPDQFVLSCLVWCGLAFPEYKISSPFNLLPKFATSFTTIRFPGILLYWGHEK